MTKFNNDTQIISSEKFNDLTLEFRKYKNTLIMNAMMTSSGQGHYLSDFLSEFNDKDDVTDDLLPVVNDVLNMNLLNEVISAESLCAYVEKENTYFISEDDLASGKELASKNSSMFIKTFSFKEIAEKWLDFLESQQD